MDNPKKLEEGYGDGRKQLVNEEQNIQQDHCKKYSGIEPANTSGIENEKEQTCSIAGKKEEQTLLTKQKSKRVATLDAFRGLTIVVYTKNNYAPFFIYIYIYIGKAVETYNSVMGTFCS